MHNKGTFCNGTIIFILPHQNIKSGYFIKNEHSQQCIQLDNNIDIGDKNQNSKEPTISEIAKELELPKEDVVFALDAIADPVSLFEPVYHDGGEAIFVMDQVKDTKNVDENWLENIALSEAMKHLDEREKHILNLRFFQSRTQMEVASEIGISQAQVSRLEKSALKQLRKYI